MKQIRLGMADWYCKRAARTAQFGNRRDFSHASERVPGRASAGIWRFALGRKESGGGVRVHGAADRRLVIDDFLEAVRGAPEDGDGPVVIFFDLPNARCLLLGRMILRAPSFNPSIDSLPISEARGEK